MPLSNVEVLRRRQRARRREQLRLASTALGDRSRHRTNFRPSSAPLHRRGGEAQKRISHVSRIRGLPPRKSNRKGLVSNFRSAVKQGRPSSATGAHSVTVKTKNIVNVASPSGSRNQYDYRLWSKKPMKWLDHVGESPHLHPRSASPILEVDEYESNIETEEDEEDTEEDSFENVIQMFPRTENDVFQRHKRVITPSNQQQQPQVVRLPPCWRDFEKDVERNRKKLNEKKTDVTKSKSKSKKPVHIQRIKIGRKKVHSNIKKNSNTKRKVKVKNEKSRTSYFRGREANKRRLKVQQREQELASLRAILKARDPIPYNGKGTLRFYRIGKVLGQGSFGSVRLATHRFTTKKVAIKTYSKERFKNCSVQTWHQVQREFRNEVQIMSALHHPNIVRMYEAFPGTHKSSESSEFHIVMECANGGNLWNCLRKEVIPEVEVRNLIHPLFKAVHFMHTNGIAHRDIKLENLLVFSEKNVSKSKMAKVSTLHFENDVPLREGESPNDKTHAAPTIAAARAASRTFNTTQKMHRLLKLSDFGLSLKIPKTEKSRNIFLCHDHCGTPSYMAPEILSRKSYKPVPADVWALGVVLFSMLTGKLPFRARNESQLQRLVNSGKLHFPSYLSTTVRNLIGRMICVDPNRRASLDECINHPWFQNVGKNEEEKDMKNENLYFFENEKNIFYENVEDAFNKIGDVFGIRKSRNVLQKLEDFGFNKNAVISAVLANHHNARTTAFYLALETENVNDIEETVEKMKSKKRVAKDVSIRSISLSSSSEKEKRSDSISIPEDNFNFETKNKANVSDEISEQMPVEIQTQIAMPLPIPEQNSKPMHVRKDEMQKKKIKLKTMRPVKIINTNNTDITKINANGATTEKKKIRVGVVSGGFAFRRHQKVENAKSSFPASSFVKEENRKNMESKYSNLKKKKEKVALKVKPKKRIGLAELRAASFQKK
eukprot:g386.t1